MTQLRANGDGKKRRRWSAEENADLLMRHLKNCESQADLSDATGVSPTLLSQLSKTLFEGATTIFETRRGGKAALESEVAAKDARITELQEVVTELSTEILRLKKTSGVRSVALGSTPRSRRTS